MPISQYHQSIRSIIIFSNRTGVYEKCTRMTPQVCVANQDLSDQLYVGKGYAASGIFVYGGQDTKELIACKRQRFQVELLLAKARSEDEGQSILVWLNLANEAQNGMMSYPNFGDVDKEIHHPDLVVLARLCEDAGVDASSHRLIRASTASSKR